jgi:hypothetical protein
MWTVSGSTIGAESGANVGIGTMAPAAKFQVVSPNQNTAFFIDTLTHSLTAGAGMLGYSDSGAPLSSGDRLGYLLLGGATDSSHHLANSAGILGFATENWSNTSQGSALSFVTTPNGSTVAARSERMRIDQNGNVAVGTTVPSGAP